MTCGVARKEFRIWECLLGRLTSGGAWGFGKINNGEWRLTGRDLGEKGKRGF